MKSILLSICGTLVYYLFKMIEPMINMEYRYKKELTLDKYASSVSFISYFKNAITSLSIFIKFLYPFIIFHLILSLLLTILCIIYQSSVIFDLLFSI
jgi:hypothetical protein